MTREGAERYLLNPADSPFVIKTFETDVEYRDDISAVVHPADWTTRPQTVTKEQNQRYH